MKKLPEQGQNFFNQAMALSKVLEEVAISDDPMLTIQKTNTRTLLFRLEGLARIFAKIHNPKRFTKMNEQFKVLEDAIGQYDFLQEVLVQVSKNRKQNLSLHHKMKTEISEQKELIEQLIVQQYIGVNGLFPKIFRKLSTAKWQKRKKFKKSLTQYFQNELKECQEFIQSSNFVDIEDDLHEVRRKLRWISIYATALNGQVQFIQVPDVPENLQQYYTEELINNPFNQMPAPTNTHVVVYFLAPAFYALSDTIAQLGILKDKGLFEEFLGNNQENSAKNNQDVGSSIFYNDLLKKGQIICQKLINNKILNILIWKNNLK